MQLKLLVRFCAVYVKIITISIFYVHLKIVVTFCLQGQDFAKEHGLVFMETSAKTAANVEDVSN